MARPKKNALRQIFMCETPGGAVAILASGHIGSAELYALKDQIELLAKGVFKDEKNGGNIHHMHQDQGY